MLKKDEIIVGDAQNLDKILAPRSVDLSIIKPPYFNLKGDPAKHIDLIKTIMKKITKVTKIGGICCLIISEDMAEDQIMDTTELKALFDVQEDPEIGSKWNFSEKILWVKSTEKAVESLMPIEEGTLVSFDQTPFSTIFILVRRDFDDDYEELDISSRIENLKVSEAKKQEMYDPMWFIPPKSEKDYKDYLPKELIIKLIMLFSKNNNLVFDPFSGDGITAVAAHTLKRNFVCIDKDKEKVEKAKKRIKKLI